MPKKSWKILVGDCRKKLQELPDKSVHMIWTSPPYFGLRDYGNDDQIGLEPSPDEFVDAMVKVMRDCHRVLRDDGTLWLNIGDSYAGSNKGVMSDGSVVGGNKQKTNPGSMTVSRKTGTPEHYKSKDLMGIPWRVAFALQRDGWYLRSDIIWAKGVSGQDDFLDNMWRSMQQAGISEAKARKAMELVDPHVGSCMPESVLDRCTTSHEHLFMLTKNRKYFYDHYAIRENPSTAIDGRGSWGDRKEAGHPTRYGDTDSKSYSGDATMPSLSAVAGGRNRRTVWCVGTSSFKGAHFATAPESLIEPCIKAGTSEFGCCPECGEPCERKIDHGGGHSPCDCDESDPVPCVVLDPFAGAATTLLVADRLGRDSIGIELNPEYAEIAENRLEEHSREAYAPWDDRYIPLSDEGELPDRMDLSELFASDENQE